MDCTGTCHCSPNNHIGTRSNKATDFSLVWKLKGYILLNSQNIQIKSARPILVMNAKTSEMLPWSWAWISRNDSRITYAWCKWLRNWHAAGIWTLWLPRPSHTRSGVGNLLVVLCRSNVAKSLSVPTHPSPPYFYIQQSLKRVNLILY